jgi:predicted HicB family RNase H-like nuclease
MYTGGRRKESTTITLRIDKDVIDRLYDESDCDSISLNSLVNQI